MTCPELLIVHSRSLVVLSSWRARWIVGIGSRAGRCLELLAAADAERVIWWRRFSGGRPLRAVGLSYSMWSEGFLSTWRECNVVVARVCVRNFSPFQCFLLILLLFLAYSKRVHSGNTRRLLRIGKPLLTKRIYRWHCDASILWEGGAFTSTFSHAHLHRSQGASQRTRFPRNPARANSANNKHSKLEHAPMPSSICVSPAILADKPLLD